MTQQPNISSSNSYSLLALGDSYTIGEGVPMEDCWPHQLYAALTSTKFAISTPKIIAQTGWTTADLQKALSKEEKLGNFDYVSLLIGVNNQYQGKSLEQFKKEVTVLLDMAIKYSNKGKYNVFVLSIPDWSVSPFAKNKDKDKIALEINNFNRVLKEVSKNKEVLFIDITPLSRLALHKSGFFAKDDLHFSKEMHQLWVSEIIRLKFNELTR